MEQFFHIDLVDSGLAKSLDELNYLIMFIDLDNIKEYSLYYCSSSECDSLCALAVQAYFAVDLLYVL